MRDKRVYGAVAAVAILGVLLGSMLPWVRLTGPFGEFTKRGLEDDSDGIITLVLGLAAVWAVAYYYFAQGKVPLASISLVLAAAGVIAVAVVNLADTHDRAAGVLGDLEKLATANATDGAPVSLVAAEGLYVLLISGIALALAGVASAAASLLPVEPVGAAVTIEETVPPEPLPESAPAEESTLEPIAEPEAQPPEGETTAPEGEAAEEES
ncbi:MAG TPA: hypothetical protein VFT91_11385 [Dehalococcoidia bacterium]|nr:hypothetical protein [Dehalococcoidia bacterium]